jgi:hypothetical protein
MIVSLGRYRPGGVPVGVARLIASSLSLLSVVGVQVDLGGGGAFVPEPERDREDVDLVGSEQHRVGVAITWNST